MRPPSSCAVLEPRRTGDETRGVASGGTIPRRRKVSTISQAVSSIQQICFRKTSGSNTEHQTFVLPRSSSNLVTPLHETPTTSKEYCLSSLTSYWSFHGNDVSVFNLWQDPRIRVAFKSPTEALCAVLVRLCRFAQGVQQSGISRPLNIPESILYIPDGSRTFRSEPFRSWDISVHIQLITFVCWNDCTGQAKCHASWCSSDSLLRIHD